MKGAEFRFYKWFIGVVYLMLFVLIVVSLAI